MAAYAQVNESKFLIPEEIPTQERTAFMGAAAAAHKAGQSHFNFGGKKHKVTMQKDTATAIADQKEAAEVKESKKAALAKKLAKASAPSEKGKKAVSLPKAPFEIPKKDLNLESSAYYTHTVAKHLAKKDGHDYSKLPVYHVGKPHQQGYAKKAKDALARGEYKSGLHDSTKIESLADRIKGKMSANEEDDVVMNPKKEKKEKNSDAEMAQESMVYTRIKEARKMKAAADKGGEHTKSATDQEEMGDKQASSKGAQDMMNTPKQVVDNPEASGDEVNKAASAGPKAAMRKGDNAAGDKKIIPSATPTKGM